VKRPVALLIVILILISNISTYARNNNAGFEGGIHKNEMDYKKTKEYKEVTFFTGSPIALEGTVEMKITDKKLVYKYILSNEDKTVTMKRDMELERIIDDTSRDRQVVEVNNITKYKETLTIEDENGEEIKAEAIILFVDDLIDKHLEIQIKPYISIGLKN